MGTSNFNQSVTGATRSLTEVFVLLRNNCIQSRHIFSDSGGRSKNSNSDDRLTLIPLGDGDSENVGLSSSRVPPEWVNIVDEIQYELSRVRTRLKDLKDLQQRHVMRPSFNDDISQEEKVIESSTLEITKMLAHCQRLVQLVQGGAPTARDSKLRKNVVISLIQTLQNISGEFRSNQSAYLNQLRNREDNYQQYFEVFSGWEDNNSKQLPSFDYDFLVDGGGSSSASGGAGAAVFGGSGEELTMKQLQRLHENTDFVKEREREILNITKSIVDVNQLFKDLAELVVDQGTVLDRIDYNVEQSSVRVKSALKSVKKAEQYQRKNRKMMAIVILSVVIIFLLVILIAVKS